MIRTPGYQLNSFTNKDRLDSEVIIASVCRDRIVSESDLPFEKPSYVRFHFEGLNRFEVVEQQFCHWGVTFNNAIAIQPSNPYFPPHSGEMVLMGAPKNGLIEITFEQPVRFLAGFVTSSRGTVLSAYDRQGTLLDRAELANANLDNDGSSIPANTELKVQSPQIYRVTFYAFEGQLIVDDISFGF
ncbi:MAG: hypothetical protein WBF52_02150 [Geitlerinemataceae cyanobacterium]